MQVFLNESWMVIQNHHTESAYHTTCFRVVCIKMQNMKNLAIENILANTKNIDASYSTIKCILVFDDFLTTYNLVFALVNSGFLCVTIPNVTVNIYIIRFQTTKCEMTSNIREKCQRETTYTFPRVQHVLVFGTKLISRGHLVIAQQCAGFTGWNLEYTET